MVPQARFEVLVIIQMEVGFAQVNNFLRSVEVSHTVQNLVSLRIVQRAGQGSRAPPKADVGAGEGGLVCKKGVTALVAIGMVVNGALRMKSSRVPQKERALKSRHWNFSRACRDLKS